MEQTAITTTIILSLWVIYELEQSWNEAKNKRKVN
jgi:hypothetical protein